MFPFILVGTGPFFQNNTAKFNHFIKQNSQNILVMTLTMASWWHWKIGSYSFFSVFLWHFGNCKKDYRKKDGREREFSQPKITTTAKNELLPFLPVTSENESQPLCTCNFANKIHISQSQAKMILHTQLKLQFLPHLACNQK